MQKNRRNLFGTLIFLAGFLLFGFSPFPGGSAKDGIEVYRGKIEEAADSIVRFPTEEEARENLHRLNGVVENFRSVLAGETPVDLEDIQEKCRFVFETHRETEVLEWCLLGLCLDGEFSLLPGEGIELTLLSFCLDAQMAGPSEDEFYSIERISGKQSEWLSPLLEYISRRPDEDLPAQELIWNMGRNVSYEDLPEDQQALLSTVVPNAEKRYGKKLGDKLLGRLVDEVKSRVDIITDLESTANQINERKSRLELILPKYDTFLLENGLLVKIKSTGSFSEITLVVVNPREEKKEDVKTPAISSVRFSGVNVMSFGIGIGRSLIIPARKSHFRASLHPSWAAPQSKWAKGKNWWKENSGKIKDWSDRAGDVKDVIDSYNEGGLEGVQDYVKGRGFDEGLDFFKSFHKGNPKAEQAFELFRNFNKDLMKADSDKQNRGGSRKLKPFRPRDYRFKPGRGDVQPLAASGGY